MKKHGVIFWTCLSTSICLMVGGFFAPPQGVIDGSVLTAVGILFLFASLDELVPLIKERQVEIKKGDTCIKIEKDD